MSVFERYDQARLHLAAAERKAAYNSARLTELLPDIREKARLEIDLQHAASRLASAREIDSLARRIQERMRSRSGESQDQPMPVSDLDQRERNHAAAAAAFAAVRERIRTKERELRQRFGLPLEG